MEGPGSVPQSNHGIMDDIGDDDNERDQDLIGCFSDFSTDNDDEGSCNSVGSSSSSSSSSSDLVEDATSSSSSSNGPLFNMSSLASQLPIKRGLSKHFEGKSQSFTSLSDVKCLEDLIKTERPFKKRLFKSSKSYGCGLDKSSLLSLSPKNSSITKKSSSSLISNINMKSRQRSFLGSRPPYPSSHKASGQFLLFARKRGV